MLEAEIAVSLGALIAGSTAFVYGTRKTIGIIRKGLAVHDAIVGKPERYPNDPEAKPGLIERLDRLDAKTDELGKRIGKIEQCISEDTK